MNPKRLLLVVVLFILLPSAAWAEPLGFRNNLGEVFYVWFWPAARKEWVRPPLYLGRQGDGSVDFVSRGKCYVVLRDQVGRDTHIGWLDLYLISQENPGGQILLDGLYETRTREVRVVVTRLVQETRILPDGSTEKTTREVPEVVTKVVTYAVRSGYVLKLVDRGGKVTTLGQTRVKPDVPRGRNDR